MNSPTKLNCPENEIKDDIMKLAHEKAGGVDKIEFYPKNSNPFTGAHGYMPICKNSYKINKR